MPQHIAFLRAVNVAPRWVKMERLRKVLSDNGFVDVETHIQSGNVRVTSSMRSGARVGAAIEELLAQEFGLEVPTIVRTPAQLTAVVRHAELLPDPIDGVVRRYVTLCAHAASPEAAAVLNAWAVPGERLLVEGADVHWWLAKPTHQAKISNARIGKLLGVSTTRDLKVMRTLAAKWGAPA